MPKYFVSAGCSFSDIHSTNFKLWNNFVADYLDCELISRGVGGTGNQFIAHSFMNAIKQKLDEGVNAEELFGIVQWSMIHRYAFPSGNEQLNDNPNFFYGDRVLYPRTFTDYDSVAKEDNGWVSIAPWQTNQDPARETPDLHELSTNYYTNIQNSYTDILNTLSMYSLVKSFCDKNNIKVMFIWMDEKDRQKVLKPEHTWIYDHLTSHIKDSIDLPGIRQQVIKYEEQVKDVWSPNDYQGHPNETGYKMYFEEHIKPELVDV